MTESEYIREIERLKKDKNAIIMAHYYQPNKIQEIADFIGDSLALAQQAAKTDAAIIVLCGVHFMGETAKIICPQKKVFVPDLSAGCSLADSINANDLKSFKEENPDYLVVSYVNTSAEVKALTDICVTSSNARKIIDMLPQDEKILFCPDRNLGSYINSVTGRNMRLWNGACHVHERFSVEALIEYKRKYPNAKVLAHPECKAALIKLADVVGSTQALLNYAKNSNEKEFLVATESGIIFEMKRACPNKNFIPIPPEISELTDEKGNIIPCVCNECNYMRLTTLEKVYRCLLDGVGEIKVDKEVSKAALSCIKKMLEMYK